jgi:hypothetical protein
LVSRIRNTLFLEEGTTFMSQEIRKAVACLPEGNKNIVS